MTPSIKSIKYLTQDEFRNLLKVIDSKRDKAIFLLAYRSESPARRAAWAANSAWRPTR